MKNPEFFTGFSLFQSFKPIVTAPSLKKSEIILNDMPFYKSLDSDMGKLYTVSTQFVLQALITTPSIHSSKVGFLCLPKWMEFDEIDVSDFG